MISENKEIAAGKRGVAFIRFPIVKVLRADEKTALFTFIASNKMH